MSDYKYKDLFLQDSVDKQLNIVFDGGVITNTELHNDQFELVESICSGDELKFGGCEASSLKFKVSNVFEQLKGKELDVKMILDGKTDAPYSFGKFKVESDIPTSDRAFKTVVAYDKMYEIINTDVAPWYNSLTFPMSLKEFRTSFANWFGLEEVDINLANDNLTVQKTIDTFELSGKAIIHAICEINGCFGRINRDGKLEYVVLKDVNTGTAISKTHYISCQYEDFITKKIDGIDVYEDGESIGNILNSGENIYPIHDNFLLYGKTTYELTTILNNLLNVIKIINYRPADIVSMGNPSLELGSAVKLETKYQTIYTYVLSRTLTGIQALRDSILTTGSEYYERNINSVKNEILKFKSKTNKLTRTVEETKSTIVDVEERLSSEIKQTASGFEVKLGQFAKETVVDTVEQFYLSSSATSLSGGSWSNSQPTWTQGKFIWRRTLVTYGDATTTFTPSENGVCITGNTGATGAQGIQGYSVVTSVSRPSFTEANWTTYAEIGRVESWSDTENIRNGCRIGDIFTVVGTATDTGKAHVAYYKSTTESGNLRGECISHSVAERGATGPQGEDGKMLYASCPTAEGTAAKVATLSSGTLTLSAGATVAVKFTNANTASSPTLNVSSTGAKSIRLNGSALTSSEYYWVAGAVVTFVYDGSYWNISDASALTKAVTANNNAMNAAKTATNFMSFDEVDGLLVGNKTDNSWNGYRAQIKNGSFNVLDENGDEISTFGANKIELGKNNADTVIDLCKGRGQIKTNGTYGGVEIDSDSFVGLDANFIGLDAKMETETDYEQSSISVRTGILNLHNSSGRKLSDGTPVVETEYSNVDLYEGKVVLSAGKEVNITSPKTNFSDDVESFKNMYAKEFYANGTALDIANRVKTGAPTVASLDDFVTHVSGLPGYVFVGRFKDTGGWGPTGTNGTWYRGFCMLQNGSSSGSNPNGFLICQHATAGTESTYIGYITGTTTYSVSWQKIPTVVTGSGWKNTVNQQLYIAASAESAYRAYLGVIDNVWSFCPSTDKYLQLGTSAHRWGNIFSSSSTISTSDKTKKHEIIPLDEGVRDFVMGLNPVSFKFDDGTSGRTHYGMISQDVEKLMAERGMTALDFAGFCKDQKIEDVFDEEGNIVEQKAIEGKFDYGLRYEEFIAPLIKTVQIQQREINELKKELNEIKSFIKSLM